VNAHTRHTHRYFTCTSFSRVQTCKKTYIPLNVFGVSDYHLVRTISAHSFRNKDWLRTKRNGLTIRNRSWLVLVTLPFFKFFESANQLTTIPPQSRRIWLGQRRQRRLGDAAAPMRLCGPDVLRNSPGPVGGRLWGTGGRLNTAQRERSRMILLLLNLELLNL
jgi:hypothetical protein